MWFLFALFSTGLRYHESFYKSSFAVTMQSPKNSDSGHRDGLHGINYMIANGRFSPYQIIFSAGHLVLSPSMTIGYIGLRYIEPSSLTNSKFFGAVTVLLLFIFLTSPFQLEYWQSSFRPISGIAILEKGRKSRRSSGLILTPF